MGDKHWGIMLAGHAFDLEDWSDALQPPFSPYVEKHGTLAVLRSDAFDTYNAASDLDQVATGVVDRLNGMMAATHSAAPVRVAGIAELGPEGITDRHVFARMDTLEARDRARAVGCALGPDGLPLPAPPPQQSTGQRWLALAEGDDNLGDLLIYHSRGADWFDMYKAVECMERVFGGEKELAEATDFPVNRIKLLKRTANVTRHARGKFEEPEKPMDRREAHELVGRMIQAVFIELEKTKADP